MTQTYLRPRPKPGARVAQGLVLMAAGVTILRLLWAVWEVWR